MDFLKSAVASAIAQGPPFPYTFGDKVDSPDAVNLPVQLAVSLLKNGRGEIDLHLPVTGTLDGRASPVCGLAPECTTISRSVAASTASSST